MFDAQLLLDQIMGSGPTGRQSDQGTGRGTSGGGQLLTGAIAGGVLGMLAGNKRARKIATNTAGTALKLGGLAAVAAVGYTAWQRHRGGAGGADALRLPPAESGFAPPRAPRGPDQLARGIMVAMIQGAKADGHIDAEEHLRIFQHIEALSLDAEAKAFVMDELAAPLDPGRVAAFATSPEVATELYAAALLAMVPDLPEERLFLTQLQTALGIEAALAAHVEATVMAELDG